jgi:hypothetical protein
MVSISILKLTEIRIRKIKMSTKKILINQHIKMANIIIQIIMIKIIKINKILIKINKIMIKINKTLIKINKTLIKINKTLIKNKTSTIYRLKNSNKIWNSPNLDTNRDSKATLSTWPKTSLNFQA